MTIDPQTLIAELLDGTINPERFDALSRWLEEDPANTRRFAEWALMEEHAREVLSASRGELDLYDDPAEALGIEPDASLIDSAVLDAVIAEALANRRRAEVAERAERMLASQPIERPAEPPPSAGDPYLLIVPRWLAYAAVAALMCGVALTIYLLAAEPDDKPAGQSPIAAEQDNEPVTASPEPVIAQAPPAMPRLLAEQQTRWAADSPRPEADGRLMPGLYQLESGYLFVSFGEGVQSILHAPISFNIDPDARLSVRRGKVFSRVTDAGVGFTIDTPTGRFVDLGTAFGVEVAESGQSVLQVTEGKVRVAPTNDNRAEQAQLVTAGNAVATSIDGRTIGPAAMVPQRFAQAWDQTRVDVRGDQQVAYLYAPPPNLAPGHVEHDDQLVVFKERAGVELDQPIMAEVFEPGRYNVFPMQAMPFSTDVKVDSYLVHYDRVGNPALGLLGTTAVITFDHPILAVITNTKTLGASDALLGSPGTDYGAHEPSRGMEQVSPNSDFQDDIILTADRKTLVVRMEVSYGVDHIRVLTEAGPTASAENQNEPAADRR